MDKRVHLVSRKATYIASSVTSFPITSTHHLLPHRLYSSPPSPSPLLITSSPIAIAATRDLGRKELPHLVNTKALNPNFSRSRHCRIEQSFASTADGSKVANPTYINRDGRLEAEDAVSVHKDLLSLTQVLESNFGDCKQSK